ncbi:MAG: molybdopterin-dependent oxidoreductase, partial [Thermodesulfobacteriota bacterium]|nr:molybdopterin-dependent oxidoreductase [Thermodesulfobacteriota bacterium]
MPFNISKGPLDKVDSQNFVGFAKKARAKMPELPAGARRNNFEEVDLGFSEETAVQEAKRCLSCGCIDAFECKLREYATEYGVDISSLESWQEKKFEIDDTHPYIIVDPNKCINCRRCMRNCSEYQCSDAIRLEPLEYDQKGKATFFGPVINDNCVSCGLCVSNCPTGALIEKTKKQPGPFHLETTSTTCSVCGCGCNLILNYIGNDLVKVTSDLKKKPNYGHLCIDGKFRYKDTNGRKRLDKPLIKQNGQFIPVEWDEAISHVVQRLKTLQKTYGPESFAGIATPACTNEEAYLFQKFLRAVIKTPNIDFFNSPSEIDISPEFISLFSTTSEYRTIETAKQILITSDNPVAQYPIIDALVRRAQRKNKATVAFVDDTFPDISDELPTAFLYSKEIFKWDANQLEQLLSMSGQEFLHLFPLVFKSNGHGLFNMGVSPNLFPGQKRANDIEERKKLENAWKTNLPEQPGLSIGKILEKTLTEDIRVIYLMGDIPEDIEHDDTVK